MSAWGPGGTEPASLVRRSWSHHRTLDKVNAPRSGDGEPCWWHHRRVPAGVKSRGGNRLTNGAGPLLFRRLAPCGWARSVVAQPSARRSESDPLRIASRHPWSTVARSGPESENPPQPPGPIGADYAEEVAASPVKRTGARTARGLGRVCHSQGGALTASHPVGDVQSWGWARWPRVRRARNRVARGAQKRSGGPAARSQSAAPARCAADTRPSRAGSDLQKVAARQVSQAQADGPQQGGDDHSR